MRLIAILLCCVSFVALGEESTLQSGLDLNSEIKCKSQDSRPLEFSIKIIAELKNPYSSRMRFSRATLSGKMNDMELISEFPIIEVFHNSNIIFARSTVPHDRWEFEMRLDPKTKVGRFSAVQTTEVHMACANCEDATPIVCAL
jgi:hypothetical protein